MWNFGVWIILIIGTCSVRTVTPSWAGCTSLPRKIIRGTRPFFSGIFRIVNTNSDMTEAVSDCGLGPKFFTSLGSLLRDNHHFCALPGFLGSPHWSGSKALLLTCRSVPLKTPLITILMKISMASVADPDPGSGAFLTPRSGMGKKSRSGSGMNIPDLVSQSWETIFWVKNI